MKLRERLEAAGLDEQETAQALSCVAGWLHDLGSTATRGPNQHAAKLATLLAIEELPISPPLGH